MSYIKRHWFVGLLALSVLLHVAGLAVLRPWARTSMAFDRQQEQERTELVREREAQRLEARQRLREQTRLTREQADTLKQEEQDKRRARLAEHVQRLQQAERELERLQQQKLEELNKRAELDLAAHRIRDIKERLDKLEGPAREVTGADDQGTDDNEKVEAAMEEVREHIEAMTQRPADYRQEARELAEATKELREATAPVFEHDQDNHRRRHMAGDLIKQAEALGEEAAELAQGVDPAVENLAVDDDPPAGSAQGATTAEATGDSPAALYEQAVGLEQAIQERFDRAMAADLAAERGISLDEAMKQVETPVPSRPSLGGALSGQRVETVADLDRHRAALERALVETGDMALRSGSLVHQAGGGEAVGPGDGGGEADPGTPSERARSTMVLQQAARGRKGHVVDMTPFMSGGGRDSGGYSDFFAADDGGGGLNPQGRVLPPTSADLIGPEIRINPDTFSRDTLPGRMITDDSPRRGWLYIDTWYLVGPWENRGRLDHRPPHPPEQAIDLDATYTDGKFAHQPDHPMHELGWDFYQSDQVRCQPPNLYANSTYYAYTELYSDRDREVLFTISTDDAAKVWLNDTVIWEDVGRSPWQVGEGFRRVLLTEGYNRLLVRIENGPIHCVWSVLFCPVDLASPL